MTRKPLFHDARRRGQWLGQWARRRFNRWPTPVRGMLWMGAGGLLFSLINTLARAFHIADISATQSLRFLDQVWASLLGWLVFADVPSGSTWAGALVILLATVWIARRESRR